MFEQLVRPFQLRNSINDKQVIVTKVAKVVTSKAIIRWGAAGTQPTPYSTGLAFNVKDPFKYEEYQRYTTDIRIENPTDASQFVTAQRIDSISFKKSDPSGGTEKTVNSGNQSGTTGGTATNTAGGGTPGSSVSDTASETVNTAPPDPKQQTFVLKG